MCYSYDIRELILQYDDHQHVVSSVKFVTLPGQFLAFHVRASTCVRFSVAAMRFEAERQQSESTHE